MVKIYTKTGDKGETGLWGGARVPKFHPRVQAYGTVDELNSCLGLALASLGESRRGLTVRKTLSRLQEDLFVVGALLATPEAHLDKLKAPFDRGLPSDAAARLEAEIDLLTEDLAPMTKFIMPGGSGPGAWLHFARTVCRRAERETAQLASSEAVPDGVIVFLNRLSDYLFTAARWVNAKAGKTETQWQGLAKR